MGIVVGKAEAGAGALKFIIRLYRILQAARLTDNRKRPVAQAHKLAESAGLKEGRHQERVAGSVNLMGHGLGIEDIRGNLSRIFPGKMPEHILIFLIACAQDHKLNILLAHLFHHVGDQVKALLIRQAGYNSDHELLIVLFKTRLLLQRAFVLNLFLTEILRGIGLGDKGIRLRIVLVVVNAV